MRLGIDEFVFFRSPRNLVESAMFGKKTPATTCTTFGMLLTPS